MEDCELFKFAPLMLVFIFDSSNEYRAFRALFSQKHFYFFLNKLFPLSSLIVRISSFFVLINFNRTSTHLLIYFPLT